VSEVDGLSNQAPRDSTVAYARNLELALFQRTDAVGRTELLAHALEKFFQDGHALERECSEGIIQRYQRDNTRLETESRRTSRLLMRYRDAFEHIKLKKPDEEAAG